ncbi:MULTISPECIES: hypothetical protein [unclassified Clostridium]|mgnify:FL=1|uniref:hypothetical protein n=1 Tax=unclassified Clostridium TaxID=2614128 RepID=UPI0025BC7795|nr:hypothetical protein [Clostridium sp.]MDY2630055.1 hypothetical protein [Clostridium sp.]MDY4252657.1 hypothetical protein [Clostridium sp.]MDY6227277.1 hypothetical protein [Clostridium sp.]
MKVKELIQVLVEQNELLIEEQEDLRDNYRIDYTEKKKLILEFSKSIKENIHKIKELKTLNNRRGQAYE